jgi:hypothetical protein
MLPFGRAARQRVVIDLKPHVVCGRSSVLSRGNATFLAPDRSGSAPVERDVLGRIQRVLELEAVRVDRQNRQLCACNGRFLAASADLALLPRSTAGSPKASPPPDLKEAKALLDELE